MTLSVVMVPGLLCTRALYGPQVAALGDHAECRIADHTRSESMRAIVDDILREAPPRFALVGLSMGGYIALEMMAVAAERVTALVLLDTSARPDRPEQTILRRELIALAEKEGIDPVIDRLLPLFIDESRLGEAELVATIRAMARDTGIDAFRRQEIAIINRADARPRLARIHCPTLVIVGDRDRLTPPELSREIAAGIPGARLEVVADCGHLTTLERPEAVNRLLLDFLVEQPCR